MQQRTDDIGAGEETEIRMRPDADFRRHAPERRRGEEIDGNDEDHGEEGIRHAIAVDPEAVPRSFLPEGETPRSNQRIADFFGAGHGNPSVRTCGEIAAQDGFIDISEPGDVVHQRVLVRLVHGRVGQAEFHDRRIGADETRIRCAAAG